MTLAERIALPLLHRLDPETAHGLALGALRLGLVPLPGGPVTGPHLRTRLAGMDLPNPLGLAAGFDKDAAALPALLRAGFGFVEVGAVTPRPQPGNPRPRLFRLAEDRAVINRFGFNSAGMAVVAERLSRPRPPGIVGVNLGANRDSPDRAADYAAVLGACGPFVDFATVNVSSPNTERLRDLQGPVALSALIAGVLRARDALPRRVAIFLKVSPDLAPAELDAVADVALAHGLDAIGATNTPTAREGLRSPLAREAGGLSGPPLAPRAAATLRRLNDRLGGRMALVAAGGIGTAAAAAERLAAGATAVQLYTALVYEGLSLVPRLLADLGPRLSRRAEPGFPRGGSTRAPDRLTDRSVNLD